MEHDRGEEIVTVGEDVGFDRDAVADRALGGKAAAVDRRSDALDDDTATPVELQFGHASAWCELHASRAITGTFGRMAVPRCRENCRLAGGGERAGDRSVPPQPRWPRCTRSPPRAAPRWPHRSTRKRE